MSSFSDALAKLACRSDDAPNGCRLWRGAKNTPGYGVLSFDGRQWMAHRLAYTLSVGPIPSGMCVCHNCPGGDNRACINPAHLWLGTNAENMADRHVKGGYDGLVRGAAIGSSRLNDESVRNIREDRRSVRAIAAEYGVSHNAIWLIRKRQNWRHIVHREESLCG